MQNDVDAKKIAQGAMEFTRRVFSADFQHNYLLDKIGEVQPIIMQ
jgi:hypothetical protein